LFIIEGKSNWSVGRQQMYMDDFDVLNRKMNGAFLGDATSMSRRVLIQSTKVRVHYRIYSKSSCKLVFKSERTKIKHKLELKVNRHYANIKLPEVGFYQMYVSNGKREYTQYEIELKFFVE